MKLIINVACLNGCGSAQNQQHGCSNRDRINQIKFLLISLLVLTCAGRAAESAIDRSNIGEITAFSGNSEIVHASSSINEGMQIGGKIYPNDIIRTGSGSVELVFGINSRIRLGSDTEIQVYSPVMNSYVESNQMFSTSDYKILLKNGIIRVRVRENFITSTLVTVIAGDIQVVAPRSDLTVSREIASNRPTYIGIMVAWGRALVNKKNVNDSEWNPNNEKKVVAGFNSLIAQRDIADESIKWEQISIAEAQDAVEELPFSVDLNVGDYDEIPDIIPELQGA